MNWIKKATCLLLSVSIIFSGVTFVRAGKSEAAVYYYYNKYNVNTAGWSLINDGTASGQVYKSWIDSGVYSGDWLHSNEAYYRIHDDYWRDGYGYVSVDGSGNLNAYGWAGGLNSKYSNNAYYRDNVYYAPVRIEQYRPYESSSEGSSYSVYRLTTNPPKTRGTLVTSDIKAIDGTYPNDGIHSDGFWYVKGAEVPNSLPQINVIQSGNKSINLKSGFDTFIIAGTASDSDNDTLSIRATINGVQKQVSVSNTSTAKSWSLTWRTAEFSATGTSSNIMITADDGRGGVVTTSYNGSLTIDKTRLFYWDKYTVSKIHNYIETDWVYEGDEDLKYGLIWTGPTTYTFDPISGRYAVPGRESWIETRRDNKTYTLYGTVDNQNVHSLRRWDITYYTPPGETIRTGTYIKVYNKFVRTVETPARGSLVQSNILDLDGTYPDNGVANGYWYVKKTTTNMPPVLAVDNSDIIANRKTSHVSLKGTVLDTDGDVVTVRASVGGVEKLTTLNSAVTARSWELKWSTSELPEGVYSNLAIEAEDGQGKDIIRYSGLMTVDQTSPDIVVTPTKQDWSTDSIIVGVNYIDLISGIAPQEINYKWSSSLETPTNWDTASSNQTVLTMQNEGQWYLHVRAKDKAGNETISMVGPYQYQQQPEIPTIRLNAVGEDWAEIGWSLPNGSLADGYSYTIENTVTGQSWSVAYPIDQIREEGLTAGSIYQYRIKASNHVGESAWSEQIEVLTLPAAVENLKVSFVPNNSSTVNISFDGVASAESYLLTIKEGANLAYEEELSAAGTSPVKGLEAGKQYTAMVTAYNASGYGQSSVLGFLSLPAAPGEFQSVQIRETEVELKWNASPTVSLYELLRDAVNRYSGPDLTYTDGGLESGTQYDYSISATNESGFGDIAYLNGVLTLPAKTVLTAKKIEKDAVSFSIEPVRGAEHYVVMVNGVKEKELAPDTKQFKIDSLTPGTEYMFEVYAENRSGAGVADKVTVRTLPDKPDGVTITRIGENETKLSWEPVQGADKYKISVTDAVYFETSGTDVLLTNLLAGTVYELKVYAGNSSGYGEAAVGTFLTLPSIPDVQLKSVQSGQFTLAWNKVTSATKYVLYDENNKPIGETEETSFTVENLRSGETRTVFVAAVNETGEGKKSGFTQRTLPADWSVDPADPESSQPISIGDRGEHSVVIVVEPVEGADQYKIVDGNGIVVGIITAPETAKEIGGLESAKEYTDWTIIPVNDAGEGQAAPVPPFVTLPSTDFTVSVGNPTTSSLTINVDSQLTNEIFVYTQSGKELYLGKDKTFTVRNLEADQNYAFQVWAENSTGDKTVPKSATGQTLPVPLSGGSGGGGSIPMKPEPLVEENKPMIPNTDESQPGTRKPGFLDIDRSFAKEEILALYDKGIVKGVSDFKFEPDRQVTRVEFASMLVRALELQEASDAALTFEDVQRTAWYAPELSAAVLNGVAKGISAKEFRPFDPITREQAAKMIANAAYQGNVPSAEVNFSDASSIAFWAKPEVAALTTEQVITGYPDQTFKPKRDLTRAECAALIYRALRLYQ